MVNYCWNCVNCTSELMQVDEHNYYAYSCDKGWIALEHENCRDYEGIFDN